MSFFYKIIFFILLSVSLSAFARQLPDDIEPGSSANDISLPLDKHSAAELVRVETHGKVLSVDTLERKGEKIFKVKVLHRNGKVKNYLINANTARPHH
jgi:uncharacterized membrane protein YkoI